MRIYVEPILKYLKTKVQNLHFYDRSSSISLLATFWNALHVTLAKIITTNSNYYLQMLYLRSSRVKIWKNDLKEYKKYPMTNLIRIDGWSKNLPEVNFF